MIEQIIVRVNDLKNHHTINIFQHIEYAEIDSRDCSVFHSRGRKI